MPSDKSRARQSADGRFAPSPTGPLHFGSLLAATASYLQARSQGGHWYLRIDDIDPPREAPGARDDIPRVLEAFGFQWDGPIRYQSQHLAQYHAAIRQLLDAGLAYPCACTRREIREQGRQGPDGPIYPGTCRHGLAPGREGRAIRALTRNARIRFQDALQGTIDTDLEANMGDFVIRRADGLVAYHLAAAVDDGSDDIGEVIRGIDLLPSTPRQIHLMQQLGLVAPRYGHIPLALSPGGQKLSKQTGALPLDPSQPGPQLFQALRHLRQAPPDHLARASLPEIWQWAFSHWQMKALAGQDRTGEAVAVASDYQPGH
ncbi:tRNA glutamyl-Q(34) synthetase GluQRS [Natronospira bacteriovora]|uniref:Glutamyl-Q tRNA(Asp) synthetase n=1 Tax=Natronospira bacteriovora TaxID=3069753 RepID=A0ABU0W5A8_9GAMM|nr:tRNA glutamyl-Q(34) synthetase GluQRS [Natronospira sp. AB-CW4]MDQ2069152.1 tRNA glutamyl-Q(34) synthetase GluQRS [Natronospira sp. AB-CW4]